MTKLITQLINRLGNQCPLVLPHVVQQSKILTNLQIMRIIGISHVIEIMYITRIIDKTLSAWVSVLNPIFQKMSSMK